MMGSCDPHFHNQDTTLTVGIWKEKDADRGRNLGVGDAKGSIIPLDLQTYNKFSKSF